MSIKTAPVEPTYEIKVFFGYSELDSRFWPTDEGWLQSQSRKRVYDKDGHLVEVTEWQDTGGRIWIGGPPPEKKLDPSRPRLLHRSRNAVLRLWRGAVSRLQGRSDHGTDRRDEH